MAGEILTPEQILDAIRARALKDGDDFVMRVQRKRSDAGLPEPVAMFEHALVEHFVFPEKWLPRLAGAGPLFLLTAFHSSASQTPVSGPLPVRVEGQGHQPRAADPWVTDLSDWSGPTTITYPVKDENKRPGRGQSDAVYQSVPVAPGGAPSQTTVPADGSHGGAVSTDLQRTMAQLQQQVANNAQRERDLAERAKQMEIEGIKRENDARVQRLERDLSELRRQGPQAPQAQAPAGPNIAEVLREATPLLLAVVKSNSDQRLELAKMQMEQAQRIAEAQAAAAAENARLNQTLLQSMLTRPIIDPQLAEIMKPKEDASLRIVNHMAESMGTMTSVFMNLLSTVAESGLLGGREEESEGLKAIKEVMKGVGALVMSNMGAARNVAQQPQPRALPPGQQPQRRRPRPAQQAQPEVQPEAPAPEALKAEAAPKPEVKQPEVVKDEPPPAATADTQKSSLEFISGMITSMANPEEVAREIFDRIEDLKPTLVACGGDFAAFITDDEGLGLEGWLNESVENVAYFREIIMAVATVGEAEGRLPPGTQQQIAQHLDEIMPMEDEGDGVPDSGPEEPEEAPPAQA